MWRDALLSPLLRKEEQEEGSDKEEVSVIEVVKEETKETKEESEKSIDWILDNFKPKELCSQIKTMKAMEEDENSKPKALKENDMEYRMDNLDEYIKATEREISKRRKLIDLLGQGKRYYDGIYIEAEIVANAYRNFGQRIKDVSVKLTGKGLASPPLQPRQEGK